MSSRREIRLKNLVERHKFYTKEMESNQQYVEKEKLEKKILQNKIDIADYILEHFQQEQLDYFNF